MTAVNIHISVLWDVTPCSVVHDYKSLRGICCLYFSTVMLEAVFSYEMFVSYLPVFRASVHRRRQFLHKIPTLNTKHRAEVWVGLAVFVIRNLRILF
jgi:hypothetical protein